MQFYSARVEKKKERKKLLLVEIFFSPQAFLHYSEKKLHPERSPHLGPIFCKQNMK